MRLMRCIKTEDITNFELRDQRYTLVLQWLQEFRYSSLPILANLLDLSEVNAGKTWRIFNNMLERKLVQRVRNEYGDIEPLVMADKGGKVWLELRGVDASELATWPAPLERLRTVAHDLSVQRAVLARRDRYSQVTSEKNLAAAEGGERIIRPDAVLTDERDGSHIAFEYELTRKNHGRVYQSFQAHALNIEHGRYDGVVFLFATEASRKVYEGLFKAPKWPIYEQLPPRYHMVKTDSSYAATALLRTAFQFRFENYYVRDLTSPAAAPFGRVK